MNTSDIFTDKERIENIKQAAQEMGLPVSSPEDLNNLYLTPKKSCKFCWGIGILDAFDNELQAIKQIYCKCVKIRRVK